MPKIEEKTNDSTTPSSSQKAALDTPTRMSPVLMSINARRNSNSLPPLTLTAIATDPIEDTTHPTTPKKPDLDNTSAPALQLRRSRSQGTIG